MHIYYTRIYICTYIRMYVYYTIFIHNSKYDTVIYNNNLNNGL